MTRRRQSYPEKPWKPDVSKWAKHLDKAKELSLRSPDRPAKGWDLFRLDNLADAPQNERL
jgi:hypothetical protein